MKKYLILLLSLLFLSSCTHRVRECDKWNQGIIVAITKYGKHGKVLVRYENNAFKLKKWKYPTLGLYMTEVCKCERYIWQNKRKTK